MKTYRMLFLFLLSCICALAIGQTPTQILTSPSTDKTNTFLGTSAGNPSITGTTNLGIGYFALNSNTSGFGNTALGSEALQSNSTGARNVAIGELALQIPATASDNIGIGDSAGQLLTSGFGNVIVGSLALQKSLLAANDVVIGNQAAQYATEVNNNDSNTAIGVHAHYQATNSSYNIGIGRASNYRLTTGTGNTGLGYYATYLVPPDGLILALASGSNLGIGAYAYKVAFILNGQTTELEESLNQTITTTTGNQAVNLSAIPTYSGPLTCTARLVYRTKVGFTLGTQRWFLDATIGDNTTTTFSDTIADASLGAEDSGPSFSEIIGYFPNTADKTCYKSGQFCLGSDSGPVTEMWLGRSVYSATPSDILVSATGGSGSNIAGANFVLSGGPGTGSAASGAIVFEAALGGSSGTLWNAVGEVARVNGAGLKITPLTVGALPSAAANVGTMRTVSDSTIIASEGQTCVGGSNNTALAFSNGTGWKCF
jgi:hypothetical protein